MTQSGAGAHLGAAASSARGPSPLVASVPLRELVLERLRANIVDGTLRPGQHLVENDLAATMGVSRGPVREALHTLAREGWIDLVPRRGAFVHEPTREEVEQFFHARRLLETETAFLAARRFAGEDPPSSASVTAVLGEGQAAIKPPGESGVGHFAKIDNAFHKELAQLSGNDVLANLLGQLAIRSQWYYAPLVARRAALAHQQHLEIAAAVQAGDADLARTLMSQHIDGTENAYRQLSLERDRRTSGP